MEVKAVAREDLEKLGLVLSNEKVLDYNGNKNAIPEVYCLMVGRKINSTGELKSNFVVDKENGNTEQMEKAFTCNSLIAKERTVVDFKTLESRYVTEYYIPYDIQESTKNIQTYTECHIGNEYVTNGHYVAKYEVLFSCDEATLRLVIENSSVNIPMIEFMNDIEDYIQAVIDDESDDDNPFNNLIKDCEDYSQITMYDELGKNVTIDFTSASELTSMIVSVRQISCDFVEKDD